MDRSLPMLATAGTISPNTGDWAFEPRLDGWRTQEHIQRGEVELVTRTGRTITESVPEVRALGRTLDGDAVLDAELVAGQGLPEDFYQLAPRLSAARPAAVRRWMARELNRRGLPEQRPRRASCRL